MEAAIRHADSAPLDPDDGSPVSTLLRMLGHSHRYAREHASRVSSLAVRIGRELGLGERHLGDLRLAGTLHDVGKLCLPAPMLEKDGPLTPDEWRLVRSHPVEGERLLRPFVARREVLAAVRWHHERWDGAGYPDGLRAAATPLTGRIVAVADAFSAMTEERPYRPAMSAAAALEELERNSGAQVDPDCMAALTGVLVP